MKVKLEIKYDGKGYCGWQVQPNAESIQSAMERAIGIYLKSKKILQDVHLEVAGRTDAGVKAEGQVAAFLCEEELDLDDFCYSVNGIMQAQYIKNSTGYIFIKKAERVSSEFHPRYSPHVKEYRYHLNLGPNLDSVSWGVGKLINMEAMISAAKLVKGDVDLSSFRASDCCANTTVRTIKHSEIIRCNHGTLVYVIRGTGFLKQTVRILVGTLVKVGRGQMSTEEFSKLFEFSDRRLSGQTAPAYGLVLDSIRYY